MQRLLNGDGGSLYGGGCRRLSFGDCRYFSGIEIIDCDPLGDDTGGLGACLLFTLIVRVVSALPFAGTVPVPRFDASPRMTGPERSLRDIHTFRNAGGSMAVTTGLQRQRVYCAQLQGGSSSLCWLTIHNGSAVRRIALVNRRRPRQWTHR